MVLRTGFKEGNPNYLLSNTDAGYLKIEDFNENAKSSGNERCKIDEIYQDSYIK